MDTESMLEKTYQDYCEFVKNNCIKESFAEFKVGMYIQNLRTLPSDYILLLLIAKVQGETKEESQ